MTLANVEQAMQGRDGFRLGLTSAEDVTVTTATLPPPPAGESVDLRHNLAPGCALVGSTFIMGTRAENVIGAVTRLASQAAAEPKAADSEGPGEDDRDRARWIPVDRLSLAGESLHRLASEQRDLMVMQAVLEDGKAQARAEGETDILIQLLSHLSRLEYSADWTPAETEGGGASIRADLTLHLTR